jgi:medium-chain acyl-[acyl-carrier-protein] hydrolase
MVFFKERINRRKKMDFARPYLVHYYEADSSRKLNLSPLVQYFEDIAILHSSSAGLDLAWYDDNHCGWMLMKWDIVIHSLPVFGDTVTIGTHVHSMKRFLADREFTMTAADGRLLAEGRSNWLLVDTDKRRPLRIQDKQYEGFNVSNELEADFITIGDVPPVGDTSAAGEGRLIRTAVRTTNSDIDTNSHVNNVRYIDWAVDALPADFARAHTPVSLKAQYRKELGIGCEAEVLTDIEERSLEGSASSVSRHTIRGAGEECCSIEIGWKRNA